jgi:hypothetical protein
VKQLPIRPALVVVAFIFGGVRMSADQPKLGDVLKHLRRYVATFDARMASVVADEQYRQHVEVASPRRSEDRLLRSDYALVETADGRWVGYRDTYEVDGKPVRDRDERLTRLLARGAIAEVRQIAEESSRFNLATDVVHRDVNVPSLALLLFDSRDQPRVSFRKEGEETIEGIRVWRIAYRERDTPTIVRSLEGRDLKARGLVWVAPGSGQVWRTSIAWDDVRASVIVDYGRSNIEDVLVPLKMTERYDSSTGTITGEATYSNFRQFQTAARLLAP